MVDRFDPPRDLDWKPLPMRSDIAGQYVRYSDLAEARAEIERLKRECEGFRHIAKGNWLAAEAEAQLRKEAEAERDKARAWVAMAFRMAVNEVAKGPGFIDRIRELTAPDAQAALEAYGREKLREGMKRAVDLYPQGIAAILSEMEKEGGE